MEGGGGRVEEKGGRVGGEWGEKRRIFHLNLLVFHCPLWSFFFFFLFFICLAPVRESWVFLCVHMQSGLAGDCLRVVTTEQGRARPQIPAVLLWAQAPQMSSHLSSYHLSVHLSFRACIHTTSHPCSNVHLSLFVFILSPVQFVFTNVPCYDK